MKSRSTHRGVAPNRSDCAGSTCVSTSDICKRFGRLTGRTATVGVSRRRANLRLNRQAGQQKMLWRDVVLVGSQELRSPFTFKVPPSVLPVSLCVPPGCSGGLAARVQADAQHAFSRLSVLAHGGSMTAEKAWTVAGCRPTLHARNAGANGALPGPPHSAPGTTNDPGSIPITGRRVH